MDYMFGVFFGRVFVIGGPAREDLDYLELLQNIDAAFDVNMCS